MTTAPGPDSPPTDVTSEQIRRLATRAMSNARQITDLLARIISLAEHPDEEEEGL